MTASAARAASRTRPPRHEAASRTRIAGLDRDVLGDRHPFDEAEVLVDEGDRQRVRAGRTGLPSKAIAPASGS